MTRNDSAIKKQLVDAYHILSANKMDDLTYTHLSARSANSKDFFIYPFGLLFSEVTFDNLLKVKLDGTVIEGKENQYNKTGYVIHGNIYQNRPDINFIFHLHTTAGVAVSAMKFGLLPISQFALHFYERLSYHDYNSLALDYTEHGKDMVRDLGINKAMILRNHGTLTCGSTVEEAMFYTHHLEQACKVQIEALSAGYDNLIFPSKNVCKQAVTDLMSFEENIGRRDWEAYVREIRSIKEEVSS